MSDRNDRPTSVIVTRRAGGGLYVVVGALLALVLFGGYVVLGTPGLNTQIARGPEPSQRMDVTIQHPATPAAPDRR